MIFLSDTNEDEYQVGLVDRLVLMGDSESLEISCFGEPLSLLDPDEDEFSQAEYRQRWSQLCSGYVATGATLGVMAIVLVLFLFLLCLPWSKCRRLKRCFRNQNSDENDPVTSRQRGQQSQNNFFPLSILDLFPPSMLPKLPDYEECVRDDDIPPPATPPPSVITQNMVRTRVSVENRVDHSQSGGSVFGSEGSTPPPYSSAVHSPAESGEPAPASATLQTTHLARHSPPSIATSEPQSAGMIPPLPPSVTTTATATTQSPPQSLPTTTSDAAASAQSLQTANETNSLPQR